MRRPTNVEVWGVFVHQDDPKSKRVAVTKHLGRASTIRGVRMIAKKHPTAIRFVLKGTAAEIDRANGLSLTWAHDVDLITRYVPIEYEIVKEAR